jgi:hypothetical protein
MDCQCGALWRWKWIDPPNNVVDGFDSSSEESPLNKLMFDRSFQNLEQLWPTVNNIKKNVPVLPLAVIHRERRPQTQESADGQEMRRRL